jgi:hypothetical protein
MTYAHLKGLALAVLLVAAVIWLGGCASIPVTGSQINPPAADLMRSPRSFPEMTPGEDARVKLAEAAEIHAQEARRIKRLQRYVKTVLGQ